MLSQDLFCDLELISSSFRTKLSFCSEGVQRIESWIPSVPFLLLWAKVCVSFPPHRPTKTLSSASASQMKPKPFPTRELEPRCPSGWGLCSSPQAGALSSRGCSPNPQTGDFHCAGSVLPPSDWKFPQGRACASSLRLPHRRALT